MTDTVRLFDALLSRALRFYETGQWRQALALLGRLQGFRDLPAPAAAEVHARQGEILLKHRRYPLAKQHLRAAARLSSDNPRYHFLLGLALHHDPDGEKEGALAPYRRSLELAPGQSRCASELGRLLLDLGQTEEGLALLRQGWEQSRDDPAALGRLVKGLCLAGQPDEALTLVRAVLFRSPRCPRLRKLWIDLQLAGIQRQQECASARQAREDAGPVLLPFVRLADVGDALPRKRRTDEAVALPGPHFVRLRADQGRRRAP